MSTKFTNPVDVSKALYELLGNELYVKLCYALGVSKIEADLNRQGVHNPKHAYVELWRRIMDEPAKMTPQIRIDKLTIKWIVDECPDLSHLMRSYDTILEELEREDDEMKQKVIAEYGSLNRAAEIYYSQDYKRNTAFNKGEWCMLGCMVEAEVSYAFDSQGNRRIERLTSGGLWGIESDSGKEYMQEVQEEQLEDLKGHLEAFGIDLSEWETLTENAEVKMP